MIPVTKSWADLGFEGIPETQAQVEPGPELFKRLSEEQQREILGSAAYGAYKSGAVKLEDFVGRKHDHRWGSMRYTKSLRDVVGSAEARRWLELSVSERSAQRGNRNFPPRPVQPPIRRHFLDAVKGTSHRAAENTVIASWVDVDADLAAINHGEAVRRGSDYTVNARTYRVKPNGRAFPLSGTGFYTLGRGAYRALGVYNEHGFTDTAERLLDRLKITPEERARARVVWQAAREEPAS